MMFIDDERLFRAVQPKDMFWKKDGKISSAAFKDSNGLSCDRDMGRISVSSCVCSLLNFIQRDNTVVSVNYGECTDINALVKHDPVENNEHHSLILNGNDKKELTDGKAKRLSKLVRYDYLDTYGKIVYKPD